MKVNPNSILPSQNFLKEGTVRFIAECIRENKLDMLPPAPIVRNDEQGRLVAIDGHNLIAVKSCLGQDIEVHVATSASDGVAETSEANKIRNQELANKFDVTLSEQQRVASEGIASFADLIAKYDELFSGLDFTGSV